jgi:hypothetical protein
LQCNILIGHLFQSGTIVYNLVIAHSNNCIIIKRHISIIFIMRMKVCLWDRY